LSAGTAKILEDRCHEDEIPKLTLIHDRGFLSEENIKLLDTMDGFDFVCGANKTKDVIEIIDRSIEDNNLQIVKKKEDGEIIKGHSTEEELYGKKRKIPITRTPKGEAPGEDWIYCQRRAVEDWKERPRRSFARF